MITSFKTWVLDFWASFDHATQYSLWLGVGIVALLVWAYVAYRVMRKVLGHRYHGGHWWSAADYGKLMEMLYEDQRSGKLLQHEDMRALRQYRHGDIRELHDQKSGGYF